MTLREWLAAEPFTLSMSSGFFSFFAHAGMLSVLESEDLLPAKVTGSSAGALVGGCWASGCSVEELKSRLFSLTKEDFWDPGLGFGLLKGRKFREIVSDVCKVDKLEQCRVPAAFSAFDLASLDTHVLTVGAIQNVISASCAFPLLFQPVCVDNRYYLDGGIKDRAGLKGVGEQERVFYHHIVSRSPWRRKNSAALTIPSRNNMKSLAINGIPRVGPNDLEQGKAAFKFAREQTRQALDKD
ncbi:patatin-like phospholipase family protein [Alkalimarinus coralli]|uniref:patatin-like phospholipase family protein n=1 Tax=Alkalimarinus coralli TaxID=2935863 RepID=UPI00202AD747|nr:patatin-like phospholipase family protein [Alkalimarinus coralli]